LTLVTLERIALKYLVPKGHPPSNDVATFGKITIAKFQEVVTRDAWQLMHLAGGLNFWRARCLTLQHVGVTAALAVVCRKRITGSDMSANIGETKME
jgi:hypothetical protein